VLNRFNLVRLWRKPPEGRTLSLSASNGTAPPLISFCSTCKGRLWQLRETLPANLEAIRADGRAELVLVNYNSNDGLDRWIRKFRREIRSGQLRYVHERNEQFFHASKAKNLAHFAAEGEFVVNLDGDNFIAETIPMLREAWKEHPESVSHGFCGDVKDGSFGRIGMRKRHFLALGGYDEAMMPIGHEDRDLLVRAELAGFHIVRVRQSGRPAIPNTIRDKIRHTGGVPYRTMAAENSLRIEENLAMKRTRVNPDRKPVPVRINFSIETTI